MVPTTIATEQTPALTLASSSSSSTTSHLASTLLVDGTPHENGSTDSFSSASGGALPDPVDNNSNITFFTDCTDRSNQFQPQAARGESNNRRLDVKRKEMRQFDCPGIRQQPKQQREDIEEEGAIIRKKPRISKPSRELYESFQKNMGRIRVELGLKKNHAANQLKFETERIVNGILKQEKTFIEHVTEQYEKEKKQPGKLVGNAHNLIHETLNNILSVCNNEDAKSRVRMAVEESKSFYEGWRMAQKDAALCRRNANYQKRRETKPIESQFDEIEPSKVTDSLIEKCALINGRSFRKIGLVAKPIMDKTEMLLKNMRQGVDLCKHGLSVGGPPIRYVGTEESAEVVEAVESNCRNDKSTGKINVFDTWTWVTPTYSIVKSSSNPPHQRSMGFDGKIRLFVWYDSNREVLADLISCSCVLGVDTNTVPKRLIDHHWTSLNRGNTIPDKITVTPTGLKVEFICLFARDPRPTYSKNKNTDNDSSSLARQGKPYFTTGRKLLKRVLETFGRRGVHLIFLVSTDQSVSFYKECGFENAPSNIITPFPMKGIRKNLLYKKLGTTNPFSGHKKNNPFARATLHLLGHPSVMWDFV